MGIKVEGHSHLVRDEESHAIINTDVEQYRLTMRRREMLRTQRDEINSLKISSGFEIRFFGYNFYSYPVAINYEYHIAEEKDDGKHYFKILFDF